MSKKRYVLLIFLLGIAYLLGSILVAGFDTASEVLQSERMIYTTKNMPAYRINQDFSSKPLPPLVRLESKKGEFFCSGTVISDDYVLTAAHCLMNHRMLLPGMTTEDIHVRAQGEVGFITAKAAALNQRADYALVKGDFRLYTKARILLYPEQINMLSGLYVTCGYPWGARATCYRAANFQMYYEHIVGEGLMFPGMSGGPVVDVATMVVFAVNTAVAGENIIVSSLVGLFDTLSIVVIDDRVATKQDEDGE